MLTAALVACLQDPVRVDVREPAAIGEVMARRLGARFGVPIRAHEPLRDEPLVFFAKGVTFEEFRELSAKGLDAAWRNINGVWEIYRTPDQIAAEEKRFLDVRRREIKSSFEALGEKVSWIGDDKLARLAQAVKVGDFEEASGLWYDEEMEVWPGENLLTPCIRALGADLIANAPIYSRLVFSSDGVNGTKRLAALADVLRAIQAENQRVEAALKANGALMVIQANVSGFTLDDLYNMVGAAPVERLVLEVTVGLDEIEIDVTGFDAEGKPLVSHGEWLEAWDLGEGEVSMPTMGDADPALAVERPMGEVARLVKGKPLVFSKETAEISKLLEGDFETPEDEQKVFDVWLDFMAAMPDKDFLALGASEVLISAAEAIGKPLAARLSDDTLESGPTIRLYDYDDEGEPIKIQATLDRGVSWLEEWNDIEVLDDKVLSVAPTIPRPYQTFFPRKAIADYVRANRGRPVIDLARLPSLVPTDIRSRGASDISEIALMAHGNFELMWSIDLDLLAAWQSLPATARQRSMSPEGVVVRVGAAGPITRRWTLESVRGGRWTDLLGTSGGAMFISGDADTEEHVETIKDFMLFDVGAATFDQFELKYRAFREPSVYVEYAGMESGWQVSPQDLAMLTFSMEERKRRGRNVTELTLELRDSLRVEVSCTTPVGLRSRSTNVPISDQVRNGLRIEDLPAQYRADYEKELARLRARSGG